MKKALEGIKVVDLTSALSGPFCTMMLADYGADVLKIEPLHGDQCRTWGPIDEKSGESGFYCYVNRNKKGATLNLKSEKGKQMFYDLVKDADILVENYRGGVTKKLGIDYETVKKINPSIISVMNQTVNWTKKLVLMADWISKNTGLVITLISTLTLYTAAIKLNTYWKIASNGATLKATIIEKAHLVATRSSIAAEYALAAASALKARNIKAATMAMRSFLVTAWIIYFQQTI